MRRLYQVAGRLNQHAEAREMLQKAVLIGAPEFAGPEARIRAEVEQQKSSLEKKFDDFVAEQHAERAKREADEAEGRLKSRWTDSRTKAVTAGYSGESLTNLEKFMEERGIADHEVAISHFERLHPPPPPEPTGGSHWNFFDQKKTDTGVDLEPLYAGNDEQFLANMIPVALKEARGG
jgi:hypothetical protein